MEIGVAFREITRVDPGPLAAALAKLSDDDWEARPIRRAVLAGGAHDVASCIVLRHDWEPSVSKRGFPTLQASIADWGRRNSRDVAGLMPVAQERNAATHVYTFPDWFRWQALVLPIITEVVQKLVAAPRGVLTRALFVRLKPGAVIPVHVDGQELARRAHRIHVAISDCPACYYTVGDERFTMAPGVAYDFNNCRPHGVENQGDRHRVNLMLEYLPDPEWVFPVPLFYASGA